MKKYKKQALEKFNLPIEYQVFFLKNRIEYRYCEKCKKIIPIGEVYFCEKIISSYLVDYFYSYHLDCVSKSDILKLINSSDFDYIKEKLINY